MDRHNRLSLKDCMKDWSSIDEEDGSVYTPTAEEIAQWKIEDCGGHIDSKITRKMAYTYYFYDYDEEKLKAYHMEKYSNRTYENWGLEQMFEDGFILSPAVVDWKETKGFGDMLYPTTIEGFIRTIISSDMPMRLRTLTYLKKMLPVLNPEFQKELSVILTQMIVDAQEQIRIDEQRNNEQKSVEEKSKKKTV